MLFILKDFGYFRIFLQFSLCVGGIFVILETKWIQNYIMDMSHEEITGTVVLNNSGNPGSVVAKDQDFRWG